MHQRSPRLCVLTVILALLTLLVPAGAAAAGSQPPVWGSVPSANRGEADNTLLGVDVIGTADIWAVGRHKTGPSNTRTLAQHWNGSRWQLFPTPNPSSSGGGNAELEGVSGVAGDDVWAVGFSQAFGSSRRNALIQHWDGTAWRTVPSPNPPGATRLTDVVARSANDVWAVGETGSFPPRPLILHWDGIRWTQIANNCGGSLNAITPVRGTGTLWAVGQYTTCFFNGKRWLPAQPASAPILEDVSAVSATEAWAVGRVITCFPKFCQSASTIQRWDGSRWTEVSHPIAGDLLGVQVVAANDVWAIGNENPGTAIRHWDGTAWSDVPSPNPGRGGVLKAIDARGPGELWSVGHFDDDRYVDRTLTLQAPSRTQGQVVGQTFSDFSIVSWFGPVTGSTEASFLGGHYEIPGLPAGSYLLTATDTFGECNPGSAMVTVVAGQTTMQNLHIDC